MVADKKNDATAAVKTRTVNRHHPGTSSVHSHHARLHHSGLVSTDESFQQTGWTEVSISRQVTELVCSCCQVVVGLYCLSVFCCSFVCVALLLLQTLPSGQSSALHSVSVTFRTYYSYPLCVLNAQPNVTSDNLSRLITGAMCGLASKWTVVSFTSVCN